MVESALATDQKAEWFALMHTREFSMVRGSDNMVYVRAKLPWVAVQKWRDGAPMEDQCAST